jgi:hypothetical protein
MALEVRKSDAQSAVVSLILHDKGTRIGCELWRASGLIVKIPYFDEPVLVSSRYHHSFFSLYFNFNFTFPL